MRSRPGLGQPPCSLICPVAPLVHWASSITQICLHKASGLCLLITSWQETKAANESIGMYITYTSCDFTSGLYGEYLQDPGSGFDGVPKLNCINFATGFTSAMFDYSWNWTIDPALYDVYSANYVMDEADFYANYAK